MVAKGGLSQEELAATLHVSKRDVSAAVKAIREHELTFDAINSMDAETIDELLFKERDKERKFPTSYRILKVT